MSRHEDIERGRALGDYVRAFRRNRWVILIAVIVGVGGALLLSSLEQKSYVAQAIVLFQDPNEDLSLTGTSGGIFRTAQQRAQIGADTIVTPELAAQIKAGVRTKLTAKQIQDQLSASADAASSQVFLQAEAPSGGLAAAMANRGAEAAAASQANAERDRYRRAAEQLQRRADR